MTKKFNWKIFFISLVVVLTIIILTTCLVLYFVKDKKISYIGYDGYIWHGDERTDKLSDEKVANDDAFEHTLEVAGTMAKYFDGGYVDLTNSYIALLPHYQKYSKTALFSETKIKNITVVAKNDGNLDVSIANIEDVVKSRASDAPLSVKKIRSFQVTSGQTTIEFDEPIYIDKNETIVLGGNDSVSLYYAKNIPVDDEAGNFTLIDGHVHEKLLQGTGEYPDTLAVEVKVVTDEDKPIFENLKQHIEQDMNGLSCMKDKVGNQSWGPYCYGYTLSNGNAFENKTITKISVPVQNLQIKNGKLPYIEMYIIPTYKENGVTPLPNSEEVIEKRLNPEVLTQNQVEPLAIKSQEEYQKKLEKLTQDGDYHFGWVDFECHYVIPDGYTLAFGGPAGGVDWLVADYRYNEPCVVTQTKIGDKPYYNQLRYIGAIGKKREKKDEPNYSGFTELHRMFFDCYYQHSWSKKEQVEKIESDETPVAKVEKLREVLSGKQVSILGDSISTYEGYSNEYETQNSDIKGNGHDWVEDPNQHNFYGNRVAYPDNVSHDLSSAADTWWLRTINQIDANLCVNNSFSGGLITDNLTIKRSEQLHDNTKYSDFANEKNKGQDADIYPDIVAIYMGINDFNASGNVEPSTFYTYYKRIVLNIFKEYIAHSPNLKVFVFTIPPSSSAGSKWSNVEEEYVYRQNLEKFNNKIRQIAEEIENVELVDLFNYYNMSRMESEAYAKDHLHPNTAGMKLISDCFIDALYKKYVIK